jgi:hypothetical protein
VIASVSGPPSAGALFRLASSVCNQGTEASNAATLWFYVSTDPTITSFSDDPATADILFASRSVGSLQPGQCDAESTEVVPPWLASGAFYLGAIIDELHWVPELIESNNHATGALIVLGNGG